MDRIYSPVSASPVKSFFVSMLTRDIRLEEAILDLLDNCVDGVLRLRGGSGSHPYEGYWADINFSEDSFSISDNCGGIPWSLLPYAFRMGRDPGRPQDNSGSVGVYGIGMKRAIFKIGRHCLLSTHNDQDTYEVEISPEWIDDETLWDIPVREASRLDETEGTHIVIGQLHEGIASTFGEGRDAFQLELRNLIETHYAHIIDRGFSVKINGELVEAKATKLVFADHDDGGEPPIRPFMFRGLIDDVDVFLAVGFTRPLLTEIETNNTELDIAEGIRYSSGEAGWTILCNDRAVVHRDRTELTGWGEAGVPRYHTQFIAISGIVEFRSSNPLALPTTTTKRGIDASSTLYLRVKNKMRDGMKLFTDYTNKWKGQEEQSRTQIDKGDLLTLQELKARASNLSFSATRNVPVGEQHRPTLPQVSRPPRSTRRISFVRELSDIKDVAAYLGDRNMKPSEVGEHSFDFVLGEAQE